MHDQIVRDMFNLTYIILDRDDLQSIDAFGAAILNDDDNDPDDPDGGLATVCAASMLADRLSDQLPARRSQLETCCGGLPNSIFQSSRTSETRYEESGQRYYRKRLQIRPRRCPNPGS